MAMMIHFRKLVQSRVIWYIILGVIVISFVGFFTPSLKFGGRQQKIYAGKLYGKKITMQEFSNAYSSAYLWQILSSGRMISQSAEVVEMIRHEAWLRIAALKKAEQEKIAAGNEEIVMNIQRFPLFVNPQTGVFDSGYYRALLQQIGVSPNTVEALFREQLILSKLYFRNTQAALIPPSELSRAYHVYTDLFTVDYAILARAAVENDVAVTRDQAEEFYVLYPEQFRIPERIRVSYIEIPVNSFFGEVELTDEEMLQHYTRNLEQYRADTTNETGAVEYKDFDAVKDKIAAELRAAGARRLAAGRAADLVAEMTPRTDGSEPTFRETVTAAGFEIKTLPPFGATDEVKGIDATSNFRQQALALQPDSYSSYSDPVVGRDFVYIISLGQRYDSFIPSFDVVASDASEKAKAKAVNEALTRRALEIYGTLVTKIAAGETFGAAINEFNLDPVTTPEFSMMSDLDDPNAAAIMPLCINAQKGEVCEPAPVADGVLIAYIADRKAIDSEVGLTGMREELVHMMENSRAQQLAASWRNALLVEAEFEETLPQ
ncbi:MAG: SurA N-terminal domain-containing protein [Kiritimatiellales bacterium]